MVLDLLHGLGWILVSNIQLDLELLARPVDRAQGLADHPGKVTVTLIVVVHERIADELGDLRPKLEEALAAAPPPLGVHVVVLDLLVKLGRLGRMDPTFGGNTAVSPAGLAAGLSVLHCNLSLGARRDIRTAAPDSRVTGDRASDSTGAGSKRLRALRLPRRAAQEFSAEDSRRLDLNIAVSGSLCGFELKALRKAEQNFGETQPSIPIGDSTVQPLTQPRTTRSKTRIGLIPRERVV